MKYLPLIFRYRRQRSHHGFLREHRDGLLSMWWVIEP